MKILGLLFLYMSASLMLLGQDCTPTTNFFESTGGRSSDLVVKGSDGCKKLVIDDGFEIVTLILGSIPDSTANLNIVNHDATPGDGEIAVTYYYYSGNATETLEFADAGKTAHLCRTDGKITITWSGVSFHGTVNGDLTYKTSCEMTCSM